MALARWKDLCLDAFDISVSGEFWAAALDLRLESRSDALTLLRGAKPQEATWVNLVPEPKTPFPYLVFNPVPEPKTVKNRWHWDVLSDDPDGLVAAGATLLRGPDDGIDWHVLADPAGNEFCVFAP